MRSFAGQRVVITGGSSGIGKELARQWFASVANRLLPASVGHKWRVVNIGEILTAATPQP
jgi:NAD(P)-dependent dehydrogenase (short-subunit alcohol dehydrogenase family)